MCKQGKARIILALVGSAVVTGSLRAQDAVQSRMVVVGAPKIYDDLYLQNLLTTLQTQLAGVRGVDQGTLLGHIGGVQGMDMRQLSGAISASGPATPSTSTFALAPGVSAVSYPPGYALAAGSEAATGNASAYPSGVATSTTPGTTTNISSITPSAPTPATPTLTAPSVGQSSLGAYNESLQLSYEIANTELLLQGALSDRLQKSGQPKTTFTLGFPITFTAPTDSDKELKGAVAEVRVSICPSSSAEPASIVTLLPQERSYNVASLVDKSFLGSISAVVGGLVNVGGGFLWGHKTYYLVEQQETVAALLSGGKCPATGEQQAAPEQVTFSWQIRPVLGKDFVRPGNSTDFAQVSVPYFINNGSPSQQMGTACVTVGWRKVRKGELQGALIESNERCYPITYYSTSQAASSLSVTDIGGGNVHVEAEGTFLRGNTVRLGNTFVPPANITSTEDKLTFDTTANAIAAADRVFLVGRDGNERELVAQGNGSAPPKITSAELTPFSDTQTKVTITYSPPVEDTGTTNPWVVVIGGTVFGLSNAPFFARGTLNNNATITLLVDTDLLRRSPTIELERLLWSKQQFTALWPISEQDLPKAAPVVNKVGILSSKNGLTLGVTGTNLGGLKLYYPKCDGDKDREKHCTTIPVSSNFIQVVLLKPDQPKSSTKRKYGKSETGTASREAKRPPPEDPTDGLKQIVLCKKNESEACVNGYTVVLDVPKLDTAAAKPSLDKHEPVGLNTRQVTITGTLLDQVVNVEDGKQPLRFHLTADKVPSLVLDLPDTIASVPGGHNLLVTFADKSTAASEVTVQGRQ